MSWRSLVTPIFTADNGAVPTYTQRFRIKTTEDSAVLGGMQVGVFLYNDPVFTALGMELWTDNNGSPGRLLSSSQNTFAKNTLLEVENNAYRFIGFTFPRVPLKKGMYYHAALRPTVYTGLNNSYIAWRQNWPDPQYRTGLTIETTEAANFPFELVILTEDK